MSNGIFVNQSGTWVKVTTPKVNDHGFWKPVKKAFVKQNGTWLQVFPEAGNATYNYPGSFVFTVPAGIYSIGISVQGAGGGVGGSDTYPGSPGGTGQIVVGNIDVNPDDILSICVGSAGAPGYGSAWNIGGGQGPGGASPNGFDGGSGGAAGPGGTSGGGGGGGAASTISVNGTITVVAGGGGGGGGGGFHSAGLINSTSGGGQGYNGDDGQSKETDGAGGGGGGGGYLGGSGGSITNGEDNTWTNQSDDGANSGSAGSSLAPPGCITLRTGAGSGMNGSVTISW